MTGTRAAIRYAKAILELAHEQQTTEAVFSDMVGINATIAGSQELQSLLNNPVVKDELKKASLLEIFNTVTPITKNLFELLLVNKRLPLIQAIAQQYEVLFNELKGNKIAVVTTAVPLTEAMKAKVMGKIKELTTANVTIENKVDESIIGGFILRLGDMQFNASVSHKLGQLKREFSNNLYVSQI